jgi:micrococcal nuclease
MKISFRNLFFLLVIACCFISSCGSGYTKKDSDLYLVTRVIDGDTFIIDDGTSKGERVRLIGIDTPELSRSKNKENDYYAVEATDFMVDLVENKYVKLVYDVNKKDRYQRTLAYVYLEDGTFVNALLVELGYAVVMTVPPNVKYADLYIELQQTARENKLGMWGVEIE